MGSCVDILRLRGVPEKVAEVAGCGLHEMVHGCIEEFATQPNNSIARDTLKRMILGVIHSVVPEESQLKPRIPPKLLKYLAHRSEPGKSPIKKS